MKIISNRQMDKKHFQDDSPPTYRVDEVRLKYQNALQLKYLPFANIHQQPKQATLFFFGITNSSGLPKIEVVLAFTSTITKKSSILAMISISALR